MKVHYFFIQSYLSLSDKRGSNPRPSAWEADALPTELLPHKHFQGHALKTVAKLINYFLKNNSSVKIRQA